MIFIQRIYLYILRKTDSDLKVKKYEIVFNQDDILNDKLKKLNQKLSNPFKSIENSIWALHPNTAKLLNVLIKWKKAELVIELGCSHGYSTIWIAEAVKTYGGKLLSIENNKSVAEIARKNVKNAGLSESVEFLIGDCLNELKLLNQIKMTEKSKGGKFLGLFKKKDTSHC